MYKHILLPTDGSSASEAAVQACFQLARQLGAKVTGLHVLPEFHVFTYKTEMLEDTRAQFVKDSEEHARKILSPVERLAQETGVICSTMHVVSDDPYEAIIQVAQDSQCDLIVMASHGRKGVKGLLLGSETQKVLTHSRIPVLVYRE
ncbi:universal stress protein [Pollutimonas bauzanensis]|uniref:Universal stress protein n=1 Tax=Pollutimonas bauzanensis TaxID=658167 RepID=A0A1M5ZIT0_9BURK|nr:universal stress protein [Pollutimonas bauzanensis]SHI24122.1 Nucleotide-binding universal stress protein, UspA family [Pollutimonas bauzanensis]